jgi:type I site-specific restriction-modification system R (restriction) subunit
LYDELKRRINNLEDDYKARKAAAETRGETLERLAKAAVYADEERKAYLAMLEEAYAENDLRDLAQKARQEKEWASRHPRHVLRNGPGFYPQPAKRVEYDRQAQLRASFDQDYPTQAAESSTPRVTKADVDQAIKAAEENRKGWLYIEALKDLRDAVVIRDSAERKANRVNYDVQKRFTTADPAPHASEALHARQNMVHRPPYARVEMFIRADSDLVSPDYVQQAVVDALALTGYSVPEISVTIRRL